MRVRFPHPGNVSPREAMAIQLRLRARLRLDGSGPFATVAGIDVSYDQASNLMFAGVVVMSADGRQVLETATAAVTVRFPYIPGLLSFRETPAVIEAWTQLKTRPDSSRSLCRLPIARTDPARPPPGQRGKAPGESGDAPWSIILSQPLLRSTELVEGSPQGRR